MRPLGKNTFMVPVLAIAVLAVTMLSAFQMLSPVTAGVSTGRIVPMVSVSQTLGTDVPEFSRETINNNVLWLARCIYSETKRAEEQALVAWVVRNRVETRYRGESSFRGVVLDPYQFSAFNRGSRKRRFYRSLSPYSDARGWLRTMKVAHNVYYSDESERPFAITTRHFYSERSMRGRRAPRWTRGQRPVRLTNQRIDARRFRFYSGIS